MTWDNRIVGYGDEDPQQLAANPRNWRLHGQVQQAALRDVLDKIGWVQPVIVNRRSGYVVDGHLRVMLALTEEETTIPVEYVDLSDAEEALILATLDPLSAMAGTDKDVLADLLRAMDEQEGAVAEVLQDLGKKVDVDIAAPEVERCEKCGQVLRK